MRATATTLRARSTPALDRRRRPRWHRLGATALIIVSCLQITPGSHIAGAPAAQLLAVPLLALSLSTPLPMGMTNAIRQTAILGMVIAALYLPTIFLVELPVPRVKLMAQFIAHVIVFVTVVRLAGSLDAPALRRVVRTLATLIVLGCGIQFALFPSALAVGGQRFLGFPRPDLTFTEPTWLGYLCVLLAVAALSLGDRKVAVIMIVLTIAIFTRSTFFVLVPALLTCWKPIARSRLAQAGVLAVPAIYAATTVVRLFTQSSPQRTGTSLDTRGLDIWVVRLANHDDFWPLGGSVLEAGTARYWRQVPPGSNVLAWDLYWKFGLSGLLVLTLWTVWLVYVLRRSSGLGKPALMSTAPIWVTFAALPAAMQFNNAFGLPFLWTVMGLLFVVAVRVGIDLGPESETQTMVGSRPCGPPPSSGGAESRRHPSRE